MNAMKIFFVCLAAPLVAIWHFVRFGKTMLGHTNSGNASGALGNFVLLISTTIGVLLWIIIIAIAFLIYNL